MFVVKANLLIFVLCHLIHKSQELEILGSNEEKIIVTTDSILRNTTANLFAQLNFKNWNKKLKQALLVHNFFTSVTLKDHNTLNVITKITRVDRGDNITEPYMTILNEILNEDWNGTEADFSDYNEDSILQYVDDFLNKLNGFKGNTIHESYGKLDIKDEIIHILTSDNPAMFNPLMRNVTPRTEDEDSGYVSDKEFWAPNQMTRRIFRGEKTKIKYFPFMASIHIFKGFQCAGSIIKSDLILTAASCLQLAWNNRFFRENPAFLSVRVGSNYYNGGGEEISVMEVYFYPDYNPRNLRNNIAVLRLVRHLKFRKHKKRLKKINIDRYESSLPLTTAGITIVGWGARGISNIVLDPWTNRLAFAVLDVYDLQECQEIYSKEYVTKTNFCAGFISKGGGACNHDVGGPGVVNGILTGIISFGSPACGTPDAPTVFTKVGFYADWIEEIMEQDVPHTYKKTTLQIPREPPTPPPAHLAPTTFKIEPLGAPIKPIPLDEADTLRILEDEHLFNEFLSTIFTSTEANDFTDILFNDFPVEKSNDKQQSVEQIEIKREKSKPKHRKKVQREKTMKTKSTMRQHEEPKSQNKELYESVTAAEHHTKMEGYESDKDNEEAFTLSMVTGNESNDDDVIDDNIARLLDSVDLSETDEYAVSKEINIADIEALAITKLDKELKTTRPAKAKPKVHKKTKDDVLTLLYVSDKEKISNDTFDKIGNDIEDFDENISSGMPIEINGFRDLTFRNNVTNDFKAKSVLDFMSRNELYDLLSEAIDEVAKYKRARNPLLVFFLLLNLKLSLT